ncbi:hypothetical protein MTO96_050474 [Rhipicephalus appendiculatus]
MGEYVLVKWASKDKWDLYPVRNIQSQTVACQLIDDPKYVSTLANQAVQVLWQDDEYAPAYVLGIGSQVTMERKRTRLVLGQAFFHTTEGEAGAINWLHKKLSDSHYYKKVDIGDGVLLDKKLLDRISLSTPTQPSKFARALLRAVFTAEELENSSLKGKACPANKDDPLKKALDKRRLDAVVCKEI